MEGSARVLRVAAAVAAAAILAPATAGAATLSSTRHGAVDLGDRIAFRVTGERCERVGARVRLTAGEEGTVVDGPRALPARTTEGDCAGTAQVPDFRTLRSTGWEQGDRLDVELVSSAGTVPLRHARIEVDRGRPALGSPEIVPSGDPEASRADRAVVLDAGDAISLGRVDLRRADGLALRVCATGLAGSDVELPFYVSVRQDGPDGPALVGPADAAASLPQEIARLSRLGFDGCYRLVVLPITGRLQEDAPELFLRGELGLPGALKVTSVDVTGTGARVPTAPPPPAPGMRTIFDGTSFDGWRATNCALRDGAAVNARDGSPSALTGCSMVFARPLRDVVLRFRMRRESIFDNAGIYLGPSQEIQLRSMGEYLPGGVFDQMAARWQKLSAFPDWDEIEVVQLGARHVVSVNGRTVADVLHRGGAPEPYALEVVSQPIWSYRVAAELGFGQEGSPDLSNLSELGAFWFKDVRLLECAGPADPVCRRLADARRGQVPVPAGAPDELPPEPAAAASCVRRRSVVLTLPRAGLRRVRATVGGRRATVRRTGPRKVRVTLRPGLAAKVKVRLTGRTAAGRAVRVTRTVRACR